MKQTLKIDLECNSNFYNSYDLNDLRITCEIRSFIGSFGYGPNLHTAFKDTYTPSVGDTYYFLPGVTIPRVKLKNLASDYKVKVVRDITQATHVFGSNNTLDKMTDVSWYYAVSTVQFKELYEAIKPYMDTYYTSRIDTALEFYDNDRILCDYSTMTFMLNTHIPGYIAKGDELMFSSSRRFYYVEENVTDEINHLIFNDVYDEKALLLHLNGDDAIEIDADMYASLEEMLKSQDEDNHTLAMEIMANCHYEKSLLYLELLFCNYSDTMYGCRTKNHVNFKSLVNFLGKGRGFHTSIDDIVESLRKHKQLTKERLDIILKQHGGQIENRGDSEYFRVKTITIDSKLLAEMNENYSFQIKEDYTVSPEAEAPREIEVVPETITEIPVTNESNTDYFL